MSRKTRKGTGVGRGKPPRKTQFKKGQSGNPRGRPKGARNFATALNEEFGKKISVREDGVSKNITKQDALLKSLFAKGIQGDPRASQTLLNMMVRFAEQTNPEPDMTITESDIELLRKFLPYLTEVANRIGDPNADDDQSN